MNSANHHPRVTRRLLGAIVIVTLSLALPIGIVYYSIATAFARKPIGAVSNRIPIYRFGSMKERVLWFPVLDYPSDPFAPSKRMRVRRLDLETGIESDTDLELSGKFRGWWKLIWIGDSVYYYSVKSDPEERTAIYQAQGSKFVDLSSDRLNDSMILGPPFEFEGVVSLVEQMSNGSFRIIQWIDGKWVDGREILLPRQGRVWHDDAQRDQKVLLPRTSEHPTPAPVPTAADLNVVRIGDQTLVLAQFEGSPHLFAFRDGFEFVSDDKECCSALSPVNAPSDVSGWKPLATLVESDRYVKVFSDKNAVFMAVWAGWSPHGRENKSQVIRYQPDGSRQRLDEEPDPAIQALMLDESMIAANPLESNSYVIDFNRWDSVAIHRIEGNSVRPAHVVRQGCEREYLRFWTNLAAAVIIAWMLHVLILFAGVQWLTRAAREGMYQFGLQTASLATPMRRLQAFALDASILLVALGVTCWLCCRDSMPTADQFSETQLSRAILFEFEQPISFGSYKNGVLRATFGRIVFLANQFRKTLQQHPELLVIGLMCGGALYLGRWYLEGRYNVTPGKWLAGTRTVRKTLRPVGFARSLLRDVLFWFDIPLLLTPLPAAISILLSDCRQRLGDRVADTIVIQVDQPQATTDGNFPNS